MGGCWDDDGLDVVLEDCQNEIRQWGSEWTVFVGIQNDAKRERG